LLFNLPQRSGKKAGVRSRNEQDTVGISDADVVTKLPSPPDPSFTLAIDRPTGTFSGTFTLDGKTVPYKGVIKDKSNGIGYGYYLTPSPAVKDYTGRSGRVTLEAQF
jgi:hypothetical protein